ncbi:hypothetical protein DCAR_0831013 [Daucus carota subsp. sativus]|uniref:Uncharacterized protein n=1 Tax=Daucus carota subsp. sativus TaxID=79200 RepID=A0A175YCI4_DAUCS|nr:PREDICTED: uncharacterized protein LOC108192722 [Daucus carota subsp. sativus]WOH11526.1 hypothetical protein DCAR_0831013 [Daucus carota subsp. sativus]
MDEEEIWKCKSHPSSINRTGICPTCLRNRLVDLCPNCASLLPCLTCPPPHSSSCHIASSDSLRNLIDNEPSIKRSTSLVIPILRTSSRFSSDHKSPASARRAKSIFLSLFRGKKGENEEAKTNKVSDDYAEMMRRSRSVGVKMPVEAARGRGWSFPSPIKAFRQTKTSRVVQERSPMHNG